MENRKKAIMCNPKTEIMSSDGIYEPLLWKQNICELFLFLVPSFLYFMTIIAQSYSPDLNIQEDCTA